MAEDRVAHAETTSNVATRTAHADRRRRLDRNNITSAFRQPPITIVGKRGR